MQYDQYVKLQEEHNDWSHNSKWGDQMVEAITEYFKDKPKIASIIDLGCGEGRGIETLLNMGFNYLYGMDIAKNKVEKGFSNNLPIYQGDFHDLSRFENKEFDYLFCSHAIEHALDSGKVIKGALRIAKNGLFITPIDSSSQPEYGTSPHTSNFDSEERWKDLFDSLCTTRHEYVSKTRLGHEVWTYWYES